MKQHAWMVFGAMMLAGTAQAQQAQPGAISSEARFLRQEQRDLRTGMGLKALERDRVGYSASIGVAYTRADGAGHAVTTPFELAATFPTAGKTVLKAAGDGYAHVSVPGLSRSGFADVDIGAFHSFFPAAPSLRLGAGVKIATGGVAGSDSDAVYLAASYQAPLGDRTTVGLATRVRRDVNNVPAGVSATVLSGSAQVAFATGSPAVETVFAQLGRARRVDGAGSSFAAVGADRSFGVWSGTVSLVKGLTSGSRDTTLQFDLGRKF